MSKYDSSLYTELQDLAQDVLGTLWPRVRPLLQKELQRIAEVLMQAGKLLREGKISGAEARDSIESSLESFAASCLAFVPDDFPADGWARLTKEFVEEIRRYFPAESMAARPPPSRAGGVNFGSMRGYGYIGVPQLDDEAALEWAKAMALKLEREKPASGAAPSEEALDPGRLKRLDALWGAKQQPAPQAGMDPVDCSLFAPAAAEAGGEILLQAFVHLPEKAEEARTLAVEHDEAASRRGFATLDTQIERGSTLTFDLSLSRATIGDSPQHLRWAGKTAYASFFAQIAGDAQGTLSGKLIVSQDGIPIGRILFQVKVAQQAVEPHRPGEPSGEAIHFHQAFISYASEDRVEVLKRTQMLDRLGINYFQDVLSLDPGDRWEHEIYRHIDSADLFLLFWSKAARQSTWILKELDYAIGRKGGSDTAPPEIMPVIIEGPPPPDPPDGHAGLHFDDRFIYFIQGSRRAGGEP